MVPNVRREFVGPRDNWKLSDQDFAAACELCERMVALRDGRADYLRERGLDERIYLPSHMWGQPFVASNFRKIAQQDRHTIDHLRFLTYNFTGYSMLTMAACENTPELLEVPADVDAIVRTAAGRAADAAVEFVRSTQAMPRERIVTTPRMFGESGWDVDGAVVNWDTWSNQQRINGLHGSGVLDLLQRRVRENGRARVLEIGAGFGNLAHAIHGVLGGAVDYVVVDLPESMIYSSIWLSTVLRGRRCTVARPGAPLATGEGGNGSGTTFVANHLLDEFLPQLGTFDLVLNVMSLSEMSPAQVGYYGACASDLIGETGVFYEQNYLLAGIHTDVVSILAGELPHGALLEETAATPHRGRGTARTWTNRYCGELWNRGGFTPIARGHGAAPARAAASTASALARG